jgi:hypothetical protein
VGVSSKVTLLKVLKAYETVLELHNIRPAEDSHFYRCILKMSLEPGGDWCAHSDSMAQHVMSKALHRSTSHGCLRSECTCSWEVHVGALDDTVAVYRKAWARDAPYRMHHAGACCKCRALHLLFLSP